jgi:hypothetical protein
MSSLKLNFSKSKTEIRHPVRTSKPAFDDSEDEDETVSKTTKTKKRPNAITELNNDLRTYTSLSEETSVRLAREALETDPSGINTSFTALTDSIRLRCCIR